MKISNPLDIFKSTVNNAGESVVKTYESLSENISSVASKIIPETLINNPNSIPIITPEIKPEMANKNQSPIEKRIESVYKGCYSDDPSNLTMENYLGEVSNCLECIKLGQMQNYKYVGIQQGNKCYASNNLPIAPQVDRQENCNIVCDDINSGVCGGFFYNQVYSTNINLDMINQETSKDILENFVDSNTDIEKINYGLSYMKCNILPIDSYVLFIWMVILIIFIYLIFDYIYKKNI